MNHEDLKKRTTEFARAVYAFTKPLLRSIETLDDTRQLRRAAQAVRMNYRATGLSRSRREFRARMGIVLEEADESLGGLQFFLETQFAGDTNVRALRNEAAELRNIFAASYATSLRNHNPRTDRSQERLRRQHREK